MCDCMCSTKIKTKESLLVDRWVNEFCLAKDCEREGNVVERGLRGWGLLIYGNKIKSGST